MPRTLTLYLTQPYLTLFKLLHHLVNLLHLLHLLTTLPPRWQRTSSQSTLLADLSVALMPTSLQPTYQLRLGSFTRRDITPLQAKEEANLIKLITTTYNQGDPYKKVNTSLKDPDSLKKNLSLNQQCMGERRSPQSILHALSNWHC